MRRTMFLLPLLMLLAGCASEPTFWTRSRVVPIEFAAPLDATWNPKTPPRERELRLPDRALDQVRAGAVKLFNEERRRDLTTDEVVLANEHALVIEPGDRERKFIFLLGKPRLKWIGDDLCATVRVGEATSCPREDVAFPLYFKRALLAVLEELARAALEAGPTTRAE